MRHTSLLLLFLTAALPAQGTEWVANGDFTGTLSPWTIGGAYSANPGLETGWDTTGMGASDSFGVNAGGQTPPGPYAPNWIEQQILVVQGLTYEFRADASGARPAAPTVANADIGTIWVEVDSVEVARFAFGDYAAGEVKRAQVVGRFSPASTGTVTLRIYFQRQFLGGVANPRMNLDNVSVRDVQGPTYWIAGNRRIGTTLTHRIQGAPNQFWAMGIAVNQLPGGTSFPGVNGLWYLEPATTATLGFGLLDATGAGATTMAVPADPLFLSVPLHYQGGAAGAGIDLSLPFTVVMTQ